MHSIFEKCKSSQELWRSAVIFLKENNIDNADFDAEQIFKHVFKFDRRLHDSTDLIKKEELTIFEDCLKRRANREPLQYILGEWEFYNFTLKVGKGVLIPRQDTEFVCETAINLAKNYDETSKIADLCSGSGAIAIALAQNTNAVNICAVEKYDEAFLYLEKNTKMLAPHIKTIKADVLNWHENVPDNHFDMIISNPPYITNEEMQTLEPELNFEPITALKAEQNGLLFYSEIAKNYKNKLKEGGYIVFEIGCEQGEAVSEILRSNNYSCVETKQDYANKDRCVYAIAK